MSDKSDDKGSKGIRWFDLWPVAIVFLVFVSYLAALTNGWWPFGSSGSGSNTPSASEANGQFGDAFGALSSLFNGLAFAGLLITIILQSKELAAQRTELRETRMVMAKQEKHLDYQSFALGKQNFESTFFRLVNLLDERASQLPDSNVLDPSRRGRTGFVQHVAQLNKSQNQKLQDPTVTKEEARAVYVSWVRGAAPELVTYFQLLLEALRFLDSSTIQRTHTEKQTYANILRAAISPAEKHLIFYHGLFADSHEELSILLPKYRFFEAFDMRLPILIPEGRNAWYPAGP